MDQEDIKARQREADSLRTVAFFGVALSTIATLVCVIAVPMVYNYMQQMQAVMQSEVDFCKSRSGSIWREVSRTQVLSTVNPRVARQAGYSYGDAAPAASPQAYGRTKPSAFVSSHSASQSNGGCCGCGVSPAGSPGPPGPDGMNGQDGAPGKPGQNGPPGVAPQQAQQQHSGCQECAPAAAGSPGKPGPKGNQETLELLDAQLMADSEGHPVHRGQWVRQERAGTAGKAANLVVQEFCVRSPEKPDLRPPGSVGKPGAMGPKGPNGKNGSPGDQGAPGDAGQPGSPGKPGQGGPSGSAGGQGDTGSCSHCPPPRTAPGY